MSTPNGDRPSYGDLTALFMSGHTPVAMSWSTARMWETDTPFLDFPNPDYR